MTLSRQGRRGGFENGTGMDSTAPKILLVTGSQLDPALAGYALKMAQRLDLEIVALFIRESCENGALSREAVQAFEALIDGEAARFSALARDVGVKVITVVDIGERQAAIDTICTQDPAIHFILTEREQDHEGEADPDQPRFHLQVLRSTERGFYPE